MVPVLCIDTDKELHTTLKTVLSFDFKIISALSCEKGLRMLKTEAPEVVLLTDNLPEIPCLELLQYIVNSSFAPPVIIISEADDLSFVIQTIKSGAHYFLKKPLNINNLTAAIVKALQNNTGVRNTFHTEQKIPELARLIGNSKKMKDIKREICKFADSDYPVLIRGESGTGKELIAEALHALSPRRQGPFIAKNCGAIPNTLIQSELFGSEKGAYTDATSKPGSFELAERGTLFLDEIGEMDTLAQVHLLRVLESHELVRLGGVKKIPLDVRVITATNKNLDAAIHNKEFRKDLFFRINTLILNIPPLRERKSDIPVLTRHFIANSGKKRAILSNGSLQRLIDYPWPGNVRELKAAIQRALLLTESDTIEPCDIMLNQWS